ncbi:MAG: HAD-IIB family hydrolase [Lachnospiraceae bacterium]|nr:HAD-IIB family hydrolase [Lachnospiraceae bacterium]
MKKMVFFDVDGTFLPPGHDKPLDSTLKSMKELKDNDIGTALCTGRHLKELEELGLMNLPFDGYVLLNGQLCLDGDLNRIFSDPITGRDREEILELFEKREIPTVILEEKRYYTNFINDDIIRAQADVGSPVQDIGEYEGADILMAAVYTDKDIKFTSLRTGRWNKWAADVFPKDGSKSRGIMKMMEHFGISREDTVMFGDAENDIDVIRLAGVGVAMGNAWPETKAAADLVADDADKDGIYKALKHLGLI